MIPVIAVAGVAALLLSGCTSGSSLLTQSSVSGNILMSDARHVEAVPGQNVDGTLTIVGSCFGLETSSGSFAAIFPMGSGLIEDTEQIEIPGWGTLGLGNHYQGGGGILESSSLSYHDAIPDGCRASRMIVLDPIR